MLLFRSARGGRGLCAGDASREQATGEPGLPHGTKSLALRQ